MKNIFLSLMFFVVSANADTICINKAFMKVVPSKSVQLDKYVNDHYAELLFMMERNDSLAYKTSFKILSTLSTNNSISDNDDMYWKVDKLASFLGFYEDRFESSLSKLPKSEVFSVLKFYDLKIFEHTQPNDYIDIKDRLLEKLSKQ